MSERETFVTLVGHLVGTARAHHNATGGDNPDWAHWYARRMLDDVNETLGSAMDAEHLAHWLIAADRRYRSDDQDEGWPKAYARWLIEDFGTTSTEP